MHSALSPCSRPDRTIGRAVLGERASWSSSGSRPSTLFVSRRGDRAFAWLAGVAALSGIAMGVSDRSALGGAPGPDLPVVAPGYCIRPLASLAVRDVEWGPGGAWGGELFASTSDSIVRIAQDGTVTVVASGLAGPTGIAFSTSAAFGDFLYVALEVPDTIVRISPAGVVNAFAAIPAAAFIDPIDLMFGPGVNGYSSELHLTDLAGCGCTPGRIIRYSAAGGATVVNVNNATSPSGLGVASGGIFGAGTILHADVANGASDDGAFWILPPTGDPTVLIGASTTLFFNPNSIAQGIGGPFGTDLYLGDLGAFLAAPQTFFVQRRDGAGNLSPFVAGLEVASYSEGRIAISPSGALMAVTSANAVYQVYAAPSSDLNGDGQVDGGDLGSLLADWGSIGGPADLNCDGVVDGADLGVLLATWG